MKLNLMERITILQILPKEGSFATLKITRELQDKLGMSENEYKEFGIEELNGQIKWNEKGKEEREIEIGEKAMDIISEELKNLDKDKKLNPNQISLYEKFVVKSQEE